MFADGLARRWCGRRERGARRGDIYFPQPPPLRAGAKATVAPAPKPCQTEANPLRSSARGHQRPLRLLASVRRKLRRPAAAEASLLRTGQGGGLGRHPLPYRGGPRVQVAVGLSRRLAHPGGWLAAGGNEKEPKIGYQKGAVVDRRDRREEEPGQRAGQGLSGRPLPRGLCAAARASWRHRRSALNVPPQGGEADSENLRLVALWF